MVSHNLTLSKSPNNLTRISGFTRKRSKPTQINKNCVHSGTFRGTVVRCKTHSESCCENIRFRDSLFSVVLYCLTLKMIKFTLVENVVSSISTLIGSLKKNNKRVTFYIQCKSNLKVPRDRL